MAKPSSSFSSAVANASPTSMTSSGLTDQILATQQISVSDISSMFRARVTNNEKPFTAIVKKANNRIVDDWTADVLDKLSFESKIQATRVYKMWESYKTGMDIHGYRDANEHCAAATDGEIAFPRLSQKQMLWWKSFFESDIAKMHSYGPMTISIGWSIVINEIRFSLADEKWNRLYKESDDPLWWTNHYSRLDLVENLGRQPFGWDNDTFNEIKDKVNTILAHQIVPRH